MKILVIGSGGREHTLVWKISQSPKVDKIFCIPGNAGISELAECVNISLDRFDEIVKFAKEKKIDLTVVGPEKPLADGIVDFFRENGLKIIGPDKKSSTLECSKSFAKSFMKKYNIPTAEFEVFDKYEDAIEFIDSLYEKPFNNFWVVKADGLCAGKGVTVCNSIDEMKDAVEDSMVKKKFGSSGERILIEEKLEGEEASLMAFCDGKNISLMVSSQDHKRIFDNDKGPNTGGMGAYAPAPVVTEKILKQAKKQIFENFLRGLRNEKMDYKGVIYAGIMVTSSGPKVLEFNVRFGDPETQAVLPLLKTDIVEIFSAILEERLDKIKIEWENKSSVCVVMASEGYPGDYEKGKIISGLDQIKKTNGVVVFHAGTVKQNGKYLTAGGRVLGITGTGKNLEEAIAKTYKGVKKITWEGVHYRKDIGMKGLRYAEKNSH